MRVPPLWGRGRGGDFKRELSPLGTRSGELGNRGTLVPGLEGGVRAPSSFGWVSRRAGSGSRRLGNARVSWTLDARSRWRSHVSWVSGLEQRSVVSPGRPFALALPTPSSRPSVGGVTDFLLTRSGPAPELWGWFSGRGRNAAPQGALGACRAGSRLGGCGRLRWQIGRPGWGGSGCGAFSICVSRVAGALVGSETLKPWGIVNLWCWAAATAAPPGPLQRAIPG